ncbi:cytochrome c biogenesis protein CcsA [Niveibacterium sp. SC-1]|uniref:cytochrome C assembly family protein n=1 Tax=Niveibacterium sp. SC-1 TaxID=3135646 RepID=UPI00311F09DA
MAPILLHVLPALIYLGLALAWRLRGESSSRQHVAAARAGLALALAVHGITLFADVGGADGPPRFGFSVALSMTLWLCMVFYWIEAWFARIENLQAVAMPVAAAAALLPLFFPGQHMLPNAGTLAFRLHFVVAMLAYSLLTLAAFHAFMMAVAERQLHSGHISRVISSLPPLLTLENLLFRLLGVGFALLTATVFSGVFFSEELFGKPVTFSHKIVFALASWLVFGTLLFGRAVWGWRGRRALRLTLAGLLLLFLAYIGTRFVLEIILHRPA